MRNVTFSSAGPALAASSALAFVLLFAPGAFASDTPTQATTAPAAAATAPAKQGPHGIAVVAREGAADPAWTLAQSVYGSSQLRPEGIDEAQARALAGEPVPDTASASAKELGEMRAAIHGDDAASRAVLESLVKRLGVEALLVVRLTTDRQPEARLFLAATGAYDAARYAPDDGPSGWSGTVRSLEYTMNDTTPPAPDQAAAEESKARAERLAATRKGVKEGSGKPFYTSPWFWVAVGAAALGVTTLAFATRDSSPDSVHLQMKVPQ
jgi:hypothetical protein